jgi:hypothetical protein
MRKLWINGDLEMKRFNQNVAPAHYLNKPASTKPKKENCRKGQASCLWNKIKAMNDPKGWVTLRKHPVRA